nr:hypothetical protein [Tanacetum cinerariifolium]
DFVTDDEIVFKGKKDDNMKSDSELVNDLLKDFLKPPTRNPKATESPKVGEGGMSSTTTPYPEALEKSASARLAKKGLHSKDTWETFKQVKISLPLIDAIKQIPAYAKFLKDLCTQKRKLKETLPKKIDLTEHVSAVLSSSLHPKFKDPEAPLISVLVGNITIKKALLNLDASINILPASLVDKYDLGTLCKTDTIISLADRSTKIPKVILKDVIVKVDDFYYPIDFFVMDTESPYKDVQPNIILGRPFLATIDASINCRTGAMDIAFGNRKLRLNVFNSLNSPILNDYYHIDTIDEFGDSYEAPKEDAATVSASDGSTKKKGRIVVVTTEDMQKRKNDVKVIVSQLEFMGIEIEKDDLNQKFLTSLAPEWLMHMIVWRNRSDLDTMSLDDLYNHLKVYESEVQKKSESNSQNMAFISSAKNSSGKEDVNTASVPTASTNVSPASVNIRATGKKISIQGPNVAGFDKLKVECFNCHKMGHFARECRAPRSQDKGRRDNYRRGSKVDEQTPKALMEIDGVGWDWSFMANEQEDQALVADEEAPTEFALMAKTSAESEVEGRLSEFKNQEIKFCEKIRELELQVEFKTNRIESLTNELELLKKEKGIPEFADDTVTDYSRHLPAIESTSDDAQNRNPSVPETKASPSTISSKPFIKFVKAADPPTVAKSDKKETVRKPSVKYAEQYRKPTKRTSSVRSQFRGPRVATVNRKFPTVNRKLPTVNRKFPTGNTKISTADLGNIRTAGSSQNNIDDKGYWDSGCSRHMTGNISYLSDYEPFNRGYVSFGQGGCNITSKGTMKTKCIMLGRNFKIKDDSNVLLRTPRQHNMYSIDLNNVVPHKDLTCLVAKASADECMLWHRRLGVTMGGGEFRNKEINDFCLRKGIKREFSNARTPQQNGVAERRNRTLIEAARTMLADAKLPVTFWAEAVNTACYVQNRVLVNKSQNETPYELFNGRTPDIGFLNPFGCHVMILNTLNNLRKFEAKGDEGYFIGYSMYSKAFRVFNKRTKRVEENLHVEFLENKAIKKGVGPNWLFYIDSLTNSINYVPVVGAGTHSTNFSGTKDAASQEVKKDVSSLRYIALPNWVHDALLESTSSNAQNTCKADAHESSGNPNPTASTINLPANQIETLTVETPIPTVSSPVSTTCFTDSQEPSSDTRLISKRVTNQKETPSLDNILTLTNRFEDIIRVTTNSDDSNRVEADVSNIETTIIASPTPTLKIHKPIGTKWVLKNKKDQSGIVIRNKARLVAQGHTQEKGIDYDEVFEPVSRIEAIRLFLAYASFMGFTVYQMDVKSAFLYGTIDEEVYMMQPFGF